MSLVLFDMDHTLVNMNTFWGLGRYLVRQGMIPRKTLLSVATTELLYTLHLRSLDQVMTHAHHMIAGYDAALMQHFVDDFVRSEVKPQLFNEAVACIKQHQQRGDRVIIASASPDFLVQGVAALVDVYEWIATPHPVVNKRFTPFEQPGAWGAGKVARVRRAGLLANKPHVYTDHIGDFDLVAEAGFATLVNPSRALIKIARHIPHEVVRWGILST